MKPVMFAILFFLTFASNGQVGKSDEPFLTISPIIDQEKTTNRLIISTLVSFLQSKNNSISENDSWLKSDFKKYIYPYADIYNIEQSKSGNDFFKPTLMEILATEREEQKIVKIAFVAHNPATNENFLKSVYNLMANIERDKIRFSRYLDFATQGWRSQHVESISYIISPNKKVNDDEIDKQKTEIEQLCNFFGTKPMAITYYSCVSPKELFEIRGFDYHPMMYVDKTGGLADYGNLVFSGNNAEIYTHEIVHIYTSKLFPGINKFFDEGLATYIAGSGKFDYEWHRNKLAKFLAENPTYNFANHLDAYERLYFENETSIPYLSSALICERTKRIYGKETLLQLLASGNNLWTNLQMVGLTETNINEELRKEIKLPLGKAFVEERRKP